MDHNDKTNTSKSLLSDTKAAVLSEGKVKDHMGGKGWGYNKWIISNLGKV